MRPYNLQWEKSLFIELLEKTTLSLFGMTNFWFLTIEMFRITKNFSPTTQFISQYIFSNIFSDLSWGQYFTKVKVFYF